MPYMVKLVTGIIRDGAPAPQPLSSPRYLDGKLMAQPAAALQLVSKEMARCGKLADGLLETVAGSVSLDNADLYVPVLETCSQVHELNEHITEYLADLFTAGVMGEEQADEAAGMLYLLGDFDRIVLLCRELTGMLQERIEKKYKYSKDAMKDLEKALGFLEAMYAQSLQMLCEGIPVTQGNQSVPGDAGIVPDRRAQEKKLRKRKEKVLNLSLRMRKEHRMRVSKGKCSAKLAKPFDQILNTLDRLSNSCVNFADSVVEQVLRKNSNHF